MGHPSASPLSDQQHRRLQTGGSWISIQPTNCLLYVHAYRMHHDGLNILQARTAVTQLPNQTLL